MSVLVKGWTIPKGCADCPTWCKLYLQRREFRHPDCPLIEVPTPHGRLIDADEFKNYIRSGYEEMKHLFNENLKAATLVTEGFCKDIDEAPTVIKAEK